MAYKDSDGRITIDAVEAASDIRKIDSAIADLEKSENALKKVIAHGYDGKGLANDAIIEKAQELQKRINTTISALNNAKNTINAAVNKYMKIDSEVAKRFTEKSTSNLSSLLSKFNF